MIIACKECNGKVSTTASHCPHCGVRTGEGAEISPNRQAQKRVTQHPRGSAAVLVLGILGLVICGIFGIFAWIEGNKYQKKCRERGLKPEGIAVAGKVLGIVGTCLLPLSILYIILSVACDL